MIYATIIHSAYSILRILLIYKFEQSVQVQAFIRDYYITACFGMLKWFLLLANLIGARNTWSPNGTIPINAITFASERCIQYLRLQEEYHICNT